MKKFEARLGEFPEGKELLQRLEQATLQKPVILVCLELYCGLQVESQTKNSIEGYRDTRKELAQKLEKLSKHLTKTATEIENINGEVAQQLLRYGLGPFDLPHQIRVYISQVKAVSKELGDVSFRTSPMDALNIIADCMKGADGEPNYKDIAELLNAGYAAVGVSKNLTEDNVGHLVRRALERRNQRSTS
ncbi:MAG TPA: hypothetical protein VLW84_11015 [Terriglobales bacterium]|nr:hypothetical protein [Terriglobales bacterium]